MERISLSVVIDININLNTTLKRTHTLRHYWSKFSLDHFYKSHEKGEIDILEYFSSLRKTLGIDISDFQFKEGWNSIFKAEIDGMSELLKIANLQRIAADDVTRRGFAALGNTAKHGVKYLP